MSPQPAIYIISSSPPKLSYPVKLSGGSFLCTWVLSASKLSLDKLILTHSTRRESISHCPKVNEQSTVTESVTKGRNVDIDYEYCFYASF